MRVGLSLCSFCFSLPKCATNPTNAQLLRNRERASLRAAILREVEAKGPSTMNTPSHDSLPPVSRSRYSRHRRACQNPEVAAALEQVKTDWISSSTVSRAAAIQQLAKAGCTLRGLATHLNCSEASMRWYLEVAELSETERESIASGESAKKTLADAKQKKAAAARARRLQNRNTSDTLVARVTKITTRWINEQELPTIYLEHFVEEADRRLWHSHMKPTALLDASEAALQSTLESSKPKRDRPHYGPDLLEYALDWFVLWISAALPEPELRENVLQELKGYTRDHASRFSALDAEW